MSTAKVINLDAGTTPRVVAIYPNGGTTWISIGTTGNSNARLLAADPNTRIRFDPIAGFAGTASFAFVAWDRTSGANGGVVSVGTRGERPPTARRLTMLRSRW